MLRRLLLTSGLLLAALPAAAQDASDFVVRLNRLENVSRQTAGQIEQLQYENRQLKEQLRKFQEDVEFRFQEGKGGESRAAAPALRRAPAATPAAPSAAPYGVNPGEGRPGKRGDAFDPEQNPTAPGAPRQIGTTAPSAPLTAGALAQAEPPGGHRSLPAAAIDDEADGQGGEGELPPPGYDTPVDLAPPAARAQDTDAVASAPSASIAATGTGDAQADFEAAYALVRERQYERAEMSLRQFIQSHPRDRLVAKATYWLGESYLQRNRSREAAEQFLKVSTDYANSPVAPEAMMKLGATLNALGAKTQACATLAEVERKFPSAGTSVRQGVEREQKRARCAA